ncbi:hypothetical protein HDU98_000926 [Podochytrium sp. JEL0797]|nr:hypothetical protein HDU98_000926 [Podochytrium sp. JEL0797]
MSPIPARAGVGAIPLTGSTCSILSTSYFPNTKVIPVHTATDFLTRRQYPTSQHVTLEVQNDISGIHLLFNASFSNTTIVSRCGAGHSLSASSFSLIPLIISGATNVAVVALNFSVMFNTSVQGGSTLPKCNDTNTQLQTNWFARNKYYYSGRGCGAIVVADSSNIQIIGNSFYGGIQLVNVSNTVVDGNFVTTLGSGQQGIAASNNNNPTNITFSPVVIRNNLLNMTDGIVLGMLGVQNAVGIQVLNNNISNSGWAALEVGTGAMLNQFLNNMVTNDPKYPVVSDSATVYIAGYRYGVNNTFKYNYLNASTRFCFYNDYWSAGTTIDTNICAFATFTYKLNMNWKVSIQNLLSYNSHSTFAAFCEVIQNNTCGYLKPPAPSLAWMQLAPWIYPMCQNSTFNGIPCSTNATLLKASGNCSGLALLNTVNIATVGNSYVDGVKLPKAMVTGTSHACGPYPIADALNEYNATIYTAANTTVDKNGIVRVVQNSVLGKDMPSLVSFPYSSLGIQSINWSAVAGLNVKG